MNYVFWKKIIKFFVNKKLYCIFAKNIKVMVYKEIDKLCEEVVNDPLKMFELQDYFSNNFTHKQLVEYLSYVKMDLYKLKKDHKPIPITKEDYLRLSSLFKIRGYKINPDGTVTEENRGGNRYKKD